MSELRFVGDASALPNYGFGSRSTTWWGVNGFMLIEGAGFALAFAAYFFLMAQEKQWPASAFPPDLLWGTLTAALLLLSEIPNIWTKRAAEAMDMRKVRTGLIIMSLIALPIFVTRGIEFDHLNVGWDRSAYGSITWTILGLHTTHILTDLVDTLVLTCLMFSRHGDNPRRYGDVSDNAMYWNFVVATWLPMYVCLYWVPRL